ncbi:CpsD/CapB family tyrosine-protein kinase [Puniceibacterium confluentis]|uniref:CpsD/CapB family tyrosine-protein kinase n=1 Tax=Puniceibacterium confluentis TaxID=1958944 RepID=UPI001FE352AE|nr:CpsD/CapB family tyrosine-protein kinase [Puniceibacterium confluentis]
MTMIERRKFRRKRRPYDESAGPTTAAPDSESSAIRAEAERTEAAAEAKRKAEELAAREKAQREAEAEARRRAEAQRIEAERAEATAAAEAKRRAEERAARETAQREAEAEARRRAEAQRIEAERAERAEAAAAAEAKRKAEERAAREKAQREAEAKAQAQRAAARVQIEADRQAARAQAELVADQQRQAQAKARHAAELASEAEAQARREAEKHAQQQTSDQVRRLEAEHKAAAERSLEAKPKSKPHTRRPLPLGARQAAPVTAAPSLDDIWASMDEFQVNERLLDRNRIITASRHDPAHASFDVLRTRLLQALADNGWRRVAITSPTKDCGKTFTAANLAISLSRQENCRTLLVDMDLRNPSLHKVFGVKDPGVMGDLLRGDITPERHFQRLGANSFHGGRTIAFGFNGATESYASELLQDPRTAAALRETEARLRPDVVLFDLPPALYFDDVIAFRAQYDGVLLVVGGGLTTKAEIKEVERRLGDSTPLLGVILNKAEGTTVRKYKY